METGATLLSEDIKKYHLERYVLELEADGLTILPPEVTGVTDELLDRCTDVLLARFTRMTGCPISIENGPEGELDWPSNSLMEQRARAGDLDAPAQPTQMLIQQLLQIDRCFRDLFVNPVVDALISHLIGGSGPTAAIRGRSRRLSSTNSFVKWQTTANADGDLPQLSLPLHPDQGANPLPWGTTALTANATWMLTPYTRRDGCLAYVPGSHRSNAFPGPGAVKLATPAEGPRGAVAIWPGMTWHGAFPKLTPGLRLNAVAYYRHHAVLPQENLHMTMADQPWDDCSDPERMKELIGLDDRFPYSTQMIPVPTLAKSNRASSPV